MQGQQLNQPDFAHFWGGEVRQVFDFVAGEDRHVWAVGDGGLVRKRVETAAQPNPAWIFQTTPSTARQTLLDVYFENEDEGWACGVAGQVLQTSNGGSNWTLMDQVVSGLDEPATLWRVRKTADDLLFAAGLWTFQVQDLGGSSGWTEVALKNDTGGDEDQDEFEFYALEILPQSGGGWIGFLAGQEWRFPGGGSTGTNGPKSAVLFKGASSVQGGAEWQLVERFDVGSYPSNYFEDPWDIEFDPDGQQGWLVGGTGFADGQVFVTVDGGATWAPDSQAPGNLSTQYGVAALGSGNAMTVGYAGQVWFRDGSTNPVSWTDRSDAQYTAPLAAAHGHSGDDAWVGGSWGFLRTTSDGGQNWTSTSNGADEKEELLRLVDVRAVSSNLGYAVGPMQTVVEITRSGSSVQADVLFGGINAPGGISKNALLAIDFSPGSEGVAVGEWDPSPSNGVTQYAIVYSSNGGTSWSAASQPMNDPIRLADVAHAAGSGSVATFWAVGTQETGSGDEPLVLLSRTAGATWMDMTSVSQLGTGTRLNAVSFVSGTTGYCVGFDGTDSQAFEIAYTGTSVSFDPITFGGSFAGDVEPLDVAATPAGDVVVVGRAATILELDGNGELVPMTAPPQPFGLDLHAVDMVGSTIMVGTSAPPVEAVADQLGRVLHWDGTDWDLLKASTNKRVENIYMLAADEAWLVAFGDDDPEFGKVADSVLLTSE